MTHQKRLPAPKHYPIKRKEMVYISTVEDSRSRENAIPAVVFLRDVLEYADSMKEAKDIIREGKILRNGSKLKDVRAGIGVLDTVEIPEAEEAYRVIRSGDDLKFVPVTDQEKTVGKITGKRKEGDEFVYHLHSGENFRTDKEYSTGNTLVIEDGDSREVELEEGAKVLVIDGKHAGEIDSLKEIHDRGINHDTGLVEAEFEFETRLDNLVAIEDFEVGGRDE